MSEGAPNRGEERDVRTEAVLLLGEKELAQFRRSEGIVGALDALLRQQRESWPLLRRGYDGLARVRTRSVAFDGYELRIQFNPGRITSSAAKVDERTISERPCFLCTGNLPSEQRALSHGSDYLLLCNPFPIFPVHFTIPHREHRPQRIVSAFGAFLALARDVGHGFVVFYNGPRCGASAPDHLHFQAGTSASLPIVGELPQIIRRWGESVNAGDPADVHIVSEGYGRRFVVLEGSDVKGVEALFGRVMEALQEIRPETEEPMVNILAWCSSGRWTVVVAPRAQHRPSFYGAEGEDRILLSPAAVDFGGMLITPLERDFDRLTREQIQQMFEEICWGRTEMARLRHKLVSP
jgi:ATP adenylyltransferase/5',5'''-P-1,P-4-tetraphosphate phosphorylase II